MNKSKNPQQEKMFQSASHTSDTISIWSKVFKFFIVKSFFFFAYRITIKSILKGGMSRKKKKSDEQKKKIKSWKFL